MSINITRLYDFRSDAYRVVTDLNQAGLSGQDIHLVDGPERDLDPIDDTTTADSTTGTMFSDTAEQADTADQVVRSLMSKGVSESDAQLYAEGVKRGGTIITVHVPDGREPEISHILDRYPAIDPVTKGDE